MNIINLSGLPFGDGRTKICIPLTPRDSAQLLSELEAAHPLPGHLYEWRADFFSGDPSPALSLLREKARKPVLCTLRTTLQGGQAGLPPQEYQQALTRLMDGERVFGLIDVELSCGEDRAAQLVGAAHAKGLGVVVSHHDFRATPDQETMLATLTRMKALGADLPKLAVMPRSPEDVLALLEATRKASQALGPVITMSMGALGQLSRFSGGLTGSCMTFAAGVRPSAPGQLPADKIRDILDLLEPGEKETAHEE